MTIFSELNQLLPYVVAIATAVWAVSKIEASTKALGQDIKHLSEAVVDLKETQHEMAKDFIASKERVSMEVGLIRERLINIESKCKMYHRIADDDS